MSIRHSVPFEVLKHVRDKKRMSQAAVAAAMGTVPSVLSKLQRSEEVEPELAERYLEAIGSDLAGEVREFYSRHWLASDPPSFLHPDREVLWRIDGALASLAKFEKSGKYRPILRGPIDLLRGELTSVLQYLGRRDHTIAWVGDIGVGKTTALAHAVGLLVGDGRGQRKPAFPVGSGRTTLCETEVRVSTTYGVAVEPLQNEEVIRLARDLVSALAPGATGVGVPAEINRALRNMAGMRTKRELVGEEEFQVIDPVADLLDSGLTIDETVDRFTAAMRLTERKHRQALLPEGSIDGLKWLSTLVSKINNGQDELFGIPRRITVLIPSDNLSADGQVLSVVDTRGVEGTTQRPDLIAHRDDARTLIVLCAKFADAPGTSPTRFLEDTRSSGSDAWERNRLCLLVLPRGEEALQLPGLDEPVSSRAEGYAIRKQDIAHALVKAKAEGTPVYFFDAHADKPARIWEQLRAQVSRMRKAYEDRAISAVEGVENLIKNVDLIKTGEARRRIEEASRLLLKQVRRLPETVRPAYLNLLDQLEATHPSSIAASIVREGEWETFDITSILGMGVRIDANKRIAEHSSRIEFKLQEFEADHAELRDVTESVQAIRTLIAEGRQEFLTIAHAIGRDAYGHLISRTREIWERSERRYGLGPGYKHEVASYWREFFESGDQPQNEARRAIDGRLQKAWEQTVLERLKLGTRAETDPA
jgi:transcriptional regulator with XRE-family HTH domain